MTVAEVVPAEPQTALSSLGPYRQADYVALPDDPRHELILGRLYVSPSPIYLHQAIVGQLLLMLDQVARRLAGFVAMAPLDVHLADHSVVQPDLLLVTHDRRQILKDWVEGAPDLVVEVLSPSTRDRDRGEKLRLYASSAVREIWLVDPEARQIEFLENRNGELVLVLAVDGTYRSRSIEGLELDVAGFWQTVSDRLPG